MSNEEILILNSERGKLVKSEVVKGKLEDVIKKVLIKVLYEWSPKKSDLIVMRHTHEIRVKLPLTKELYEKLSKYNLRRASSNEAIAELPVFVVSYDNTWIDDDVYDNKVYLIAPYVNEEVKEELEELAIETTSESYKPK